MGNPVKQAEQPSEQGGLYFFVVGVIDCPAWCDSPCWEPTFEKIFLELGEMEHDVAQLVGHTDASLDGGEFRTLGRVVW